MPDAKTRKAAAKDKREGKSASTQAGEYVREEIEHIREGKHGARSTEQAIAIGLSKARRAGVKVPAKKSTRKSTGKHASSKRSSSATGHRKKAITNSSAKRSRATLKALRKESGKAATRISLASHAKKAASKRTAAQRSASAKKAARTKGARGRSAAAKKAARTRAKS